MKASPSVAVAVAVAVACALTGCAVDESLSPVSTGTTTTTTETPTTTTTTTTTNPPDPGPAKRTVSVRSPLAGPANNLLFDGDFELSVSAGTGQYGWRMFNSAGTGELAMTVETGGLCRSGLTCAKIHKGELLLGRGTAAAQAKGHVAELWSRMPEGVGCNKVKAIAIECDTFIVLKGLTPEKDPEDGWCHHAAAFNPSKAAVCMYIETSLLPDQEALVDSALLGPNDGTVPLSSVAEEPVSADTLSRMANVRDLVLRTTRLGAPAPTGHDLR